MNKIDYAIMRMKPSSFFLLLICLYVQSLRAQENHSLEKEILQLAKAQGILEHQLGFVVTPIDTQKPVVRINEKKLFSPASTSKLITSWAALEKWGSAHVFQTEIKQLNKSLCIEGGGDPSLVHEKVFTIAEQVSKIINDPVETLFVDDHILPMQRSYATGFERDDQRAFTAPISGLSMNYNAMTIRVQGTEIGKPPEVRLTPDLPLFKIENKAITGQKNKNLRVEVSQKKDTWVIQVSGTVTTRHNRNYYRAMTNPPLYTGHAFATYYQMFTGKKIPEIIHSPCHPDAKTIYTHRSRPLGEMIIFMNKYSTNVIAEMLFAQLGDTYGTVEGSDYINNLFKATLPFEPNMLIENGSGLSRHSQVTPDWFVQFIHMTYKDFLFQPEIFASMGISGIDGTLKRRTKHPKLIKNIRGKTGSLTGVTTLSGIMETPYWGKCLFALFFEHPSIPTWKIVDLEKQIFATLMSRATLKKTSE
ncbi:MAG: D-alanyl-D-alanine carboxypeptidase/D-alanyl-D-alanine-endopeptidase [Deltaproteobacteria bacterium]|nr:D-alanyl-D-alanine carboxypeptidase/D-alanyl-D-alanine-endopeptidase [Deltaproteobacteria bacterium]